jgi:hypothetical protein
VADGVAITAGSGTTVATDDAGASGHVQIIKLAISTDGSATLLPASATDGLLVNLGANNDVTVTGTVTEANSAAIAASLSVVDDWDESDRAKVNLIAGQAGISAGAGAVAATTPRVTLASDDPAVVFTSAIASSTGVMDDWDESDRAKVNPIVGQAGVAAGAGAVSALTQRVVLATDQTVIPVSDNSGSLTVDSLALPVNINKHVCDAGTLVANTLETLSLTVSGFTAVEIEITNVNGAAIIYYTLDNTTPSSTNFTGVLPATPCQHVLACNATPTLKMISSGTPVFAATVRGA